MASDPTGYVDRAAFVDEVNPGDLISRDFGSGGEFWTATGRRDVPAESEGRTRVVLIGQAEDGGSPRTCSLYATEPIVIRTYLHNQATRSGGVS